MKFFKLNAYYLKLWLYVSIASLTALLTDLQHYVCHIGGEIHMTTTQIVVMVLNFMLQGLIACRAFMDDSVEKSIKEFDLPQIINENSKEIKS
jgi:hypothetical protein